MKIVKSQGVTPTERLLVTLADRTFLKLWSHGNPYKADGKELCDLSVVFGNISICFSTVKAEDSILQPRMLT
jgi:hypothetical protein